MFRRCPYFLVNPWHRVGSCQLFKECLWDVRWIITTSGTLKHIIYVISQQVYVLNTITFQIYKYSD